MKIHVFKTVNLLIKSSGMCLKQKKKMSFKKRRSYIRRYNFLLYYIFDYLTCWWQKIKVLENFIPFQHFKRVENNHQVRFITFFHIPYQVRFFDLRNRDYLPKDFRSVISRSLLLLLLLLMEWNVLKIVFSLHK